MAVVRAVLGTYPHTEPLKRGSIRSPDVVFEFIEHTPTHTAFKPMVREQAFDLCELAVVTFLQARAYGRPIALLPAAMLGRFQHHALLHNAERGRLAPADLGGRRVGVRSWSQTTGAWLRGILKHDYAVDIDRVRWVTFEDAHVAEASDPPGVERSKGDMTKMLLAGDLDAAIYGAELPADPRLKSVIAQPDSEARRWYGRYGIVPVNHLVAVKETLVHERPGLVRDAYRLLLDAKRTVPIAPGAIDFTPFGIEANRPALERIIAYAFQQELIPEKTEVDALFAPVRDLVD